jgi:hypothetical protein
VCARSDSPSRRLGEFDDKDAFEASIVATFVVRTSDGRSVELCAGGAQRRVTFENRREWARA